MPEELLQVTVRPAICLLHTYVSLKQQLFVQQGKGAAAAVSVHQCRAGRLSRQPSEAVPCQHTVLACGGCAGTCLSLEEPVCTGELPQRGGDGGTSLHHGARRLQSRERDMWSGCSLPIETRARSFSQYSSQILIKWPLVNWIGLHLVQ